MVVDEIDLLVRGGDSKLRARGGKSYCVVKIWQGTKEALAHRCL